MLECLTRTSSSTRPVSKGKIDDQVPGNRARGEIRSKNLQTELKRSGDWDVDEVLNVDYVVTNAISSRREAQLCIFGDNEAVMKMIIKGRSPTTRHVSRTHSQSCPLRSFRILFPPPLARFFVSSLPPWWAWHFPLFGMSFLFPSESLAPPASLFCPLSFRFGLSLPYALLLDKKRSRSALLSRILSLPRAILLSFGTLLFQSTNDQRRFGPHALNADAVNISLALPGKRTQPATCIMKRLSFASIDLQQWFLSWCLTIFGYLRRIWKMINKLINK